MRSSTACIMVAVLSAAPPIAPADTLYLKDGQVRTGKVISQDELEVSFQMSAAGGKITFVKKFPIAQVERIERTDEPPASTRTTSQPATRPTTDKRAAIADRPALLKQIIQDYKAKKHASASLDMTRLISASTAQELEMLDPIAADEVEMSLAELAADLRIKAAKDRAETAGFRLGLVTPYEMEALVAQLKKEYGKLLDQEAVIAADTKRKAKAEEDGPDEADQGGYFEIDPGGPRINEWLDRAGEYDGSKIEAAGFARHIAIAVGLLQERIRLDPELRKDKPLRMELAKEQRRLQKLLAAARRRMRGLPTESERRAAAEERRRQRLEHRQRLMEGQEGTRPEYAPDGARPPAEDQR